MTSTERVFLFAGVAVALGLGLSAQHVGPTAHGNAGSAVVQAEPPRLATIDVLGVMARLLESDRYKPSNLANAQKWDNTLRTLVTELEDIRSRALAMPEGAAERMPLEQEFMQKNQAFEQTRGQAQQEIEAFNTAQVAEAYRLIVDRSNAVATELGYTHVLVSRGDEVKIASKSVAGAVQEILARPMIRTAPADDLTQRIIKDFGLEGIVLPPTDGSVPPAAVPETPPTPSTPTEQPR